MTCDDVTRLLDEIAELDAPAREARAAAVADDLRRHAEACAACARRLRAEDDLRAGLAALRESSRVEPPFGFASAVRRRAEERRREEHVAGRTWPLAAGVALAASLVAAGVLFVGLSPRREAEPGRAVLTAPRPDAHATPVVWSNGGVDIVAAPEPGASAAEAVKTAAPAPGGPANDAQQVAVLVEWNL